MDKLNKVRASTNPCGSLLLRALGELLEFTMMLANCDYP